MINDERIKELSEKHTHASEQFESGLFFDENGFARAIEAAARADALEDVRREFIKAITWQDLGDFIASEILEAEKK